MGKGIGKGKNIWSFFVGLELKCFSKINHVSVLKMKHIQESWGKKQNLIMSLSWDFAG